MAKIVETTPRERTFTLDINGEELKVLVDILGRQTGGTYPLQDLYGVLEKALRN